MAIFQTVIILLGVILLIIIYEKRGYIIFRDPFSLDHKELKSFFTYPGILITFSLITFLLLRISNAFSRAMFTDEMEHLHVGWLISKGLVPFQDFFEHHPPFFWWLVSFVHSLSPAISVSNYYYLVKAGIAITAIAVFMLIFLISRSIYKSSMAGLISLTVIILSGWNSDCLFQIRPDTLMLLFYFVSILCFVYYLQVQREALCLYAGIFSLVISQFILPKLPIESMLILGFVSLEMLKRQGIKGLLVHILLPCFISAGVLLLFMSFISDLGDVFNFVIRVNCFMTSYLGDRFHFLNARDYLPIYIFSGAGIFASFVYIKKKIRSEIALLLVVFVASLLDILFFIPHLIPQYYLPMYMVMAILCGGIVLIDGFNSKILDILLVVLIFILPMKIPAYYQNMAEKKAQFQAIEYVLDNTECKDFVFVDPILHPIFRYDAGYYWFSRWRMISDMQNNFNKLEFLPHKDELMDATIAFDKKRPKFVTSPDSFTWSSLDKLEMAKYESNQFKKVPLTYFSLIATYYKEAYLAEFCPDGSCKTRKVRY